MDRIRNPDEKWGISAKKKIPCFFFVGKECLTWQPPWPERGRARSDQHAPDRRDRRSHNNPPLSLGTSAQRFSIQNFHFFFGQNEWSKREDFFFSTTKPDNKIPTHEIIFLFTLQGQYENSWSWGSSRLELHIRPRFWNYEWMIFLDSRSCIVLFFFRIGAIWNSGHPE